jgi:hypothetical protein
MATQNVVPAYRGASAGITNPSAQVETTTARAAILKQISVLQKQEAALGEALAKLGNGPETAQERIAIQQRIHGLEEQIKALQTALLQKNADRQVQVQGAPAAQASAAVGGVDGAVVGGVIDTSA